MRPALLDTAITGLTDAGWFTPPPHSFIALYELQLVCLLDQWEIKYEAQLKLAEINGILNSLALFPPAEGLSNPATQTCLDIVS